MFCIQLKKNRKKNIHLMQIPSSAFLLWQIRINKRTQCVCVLTTNHLHFIVSSIYHNHLFSSCQCSVVSIFHIIFLFMHYLCAAAHLIVPHESWRVCKCSLVRLRQGGWLWSRKISQFSCMAHACELTCTTFIHSFTIIRLRTASTAAATNVWIGPA